MHTFRRRELWHHRRRQSWALGVVFVSPPAAANARAELGPRFVAGVALELVVVILDHELHELHQHRSRDHVWRHPPASLAHLWPVQPTVQQSRPSDAAPSVPCCTITMAVGCMALASSPLHGARYANRLARRLNSDSTRTPASWSSWRAKRQVERATRVERVLTAQSRACYRPKAQLTFPPGNFIPPCNRLPRSPCNRHCWPLLETTRAPTTVTNS